jgi:hypothetical protein
MRGISGQQQTFAGALPIRQWQRRSERVHRMSLSRFGKTVGAFSPHVLGLFKVVIS